MNPLLYNCSPLRRHETKSCKLVTPMEPWETQISHESNILQKPNQIMQPPSTGSLIGSSNFPWIQPSTDWACCAKTKTNLATSLDSWTHGKLKFPMNKALYKSRLLRNIDTLSTRPCNFAKSVDSKETPIAHMNQTLDCALTKSKLATSFDWWIQGKHEFSMSPALYNRSNLLRTTRYETKSCRFARPVESWEIKISH